MSSSHNIPTCALPPDLAAWRSLVERSISSWKDLYYFKNKINDADDEANDVNPGERLAVAIYALQSYGSLEEFMQGSPSSLMFWFFQRREAFLAQKTMNKWSQDKLEDYILIPATPGFVSRSDCTFISHFWQSEENPDPDGKYLRLNQQDLSLQEWLYIWVDWTCAPQAPRSSEEEKYFNKLLATVPGIIRNCDFMWFYPPFEPRLWILYEVAEFILTSSISHRVPPDMQKYVSHVKEMVRDGVHPVLEKYDYKCTRDRDKTYLTSWLDLLVLMTRLRVDLYNMRQLLDQATWNPTCQLTYLEDTNGVVELDPSGGTLSINGKQWTFTPYPTDV